MTAPTVSTDLPLASGRWRVDAAHSGVLFAIRHLGLTNVRGRFTTFDATLLVGSSLADIQIEAAIDLSSVDTDNADRDAHLRGTDFFDTEKNPTMTFRSTAIEGAEPDWELTGDLTINGVTKPVTLEVEFHGTETFPADGSTHAGFSATGQLKRTDYGIDFGIIPGAEKLLLADKVKIELELQFVAPES